MIDTTCKCVCIGKRCTTLAMQEDLLCNACRGRECKGWSALVDADGKPNGHVLHVAVTDTCR